MRCSSSGTQTPTKVSLNDLPVPKDLIFIRGDQVNRVFLWTGIVYTPTRPMDSDGLVMYHADEEIDPDDADAVSPTALVAPWEERFWHSEIRDGYVSSMRYYNGWVPWYGTQPRNWTWWNQYSLKGVFTCFADYSDEHQGTVVSIVLPSSTSAQITPSSTYSWDLQSAHPTEFHEESGAPLRFDNLKTWMGGKVTVKIDSTLNAKISEGFS